MTTVDQSTQDIPFEVGHPVPSEGTNRTNGATSPNGHADTIRVSITIANPEAVLSEDNTPSTLIGQIAQQIIELDDSDDPSITIHTTFDPAACVGVDQHGTYQWVGGGFALSQADAQLTVKPVVASEVGCTPPANLATLITRAAIQTGAANKINDNIDVKAAKAAVAANLQNSEREAGPGGQPDDSGCVQGASPSTQSGIAHENRVPWVQSEPRTEPLPGTPGADLFKKTFPITAQASDTGEWSAYEPLDDPNAKVFVTVGHRFGWDDDRQKAVSQGHRGNGFLDPKHHKSLDDALAMADRRAAGDPVYRQRLEDADTRHPKDESRPHPHRGEPGFTHLPMRLYRNDLGDPMLPARSEGSDRAAEADELHGNPSAQQSIEPDDSGCVQGVSPSTQSGFEFGLDIDDVAEVLEVVEQAKGKMGGGRSKAIKRARAKLAVVREFAKCARVVEIGKSGDSLHLIGLRKPAAGEPGHELFAHDLTVNGIEVKAGTRNGKLSHITLTGNQTQPTLHGTKGGKRDGVVTPQAIAALEKAIKLGSGAGDRGQATPGKRHKDGLPRVLEMPGADATIARLRQLAGEALWNSALAQQRAIIDQGCEMTIDVNRWPIKYRRRLVKGILTEMLPYLSEPGERKRRIFPLLDSLHYLDFIDPAVDAKSIAKRLLGPVLDGEDRIDQRWGAFDDERERRAGSDKTIANALWEAVNHATDAKGRPLYKHPYDVLAKFQPTITPTPAPTDDQTDDPSGVQGVQGASPPTRTSKAGAQRPTAAPLGATQPANNALPKAVITANSPPNAKFTALWCADEFVDQYANTLKYVAQTRMWYRWDNVCWSLCERQEHVVEAKNLTGDLAARAITAQEPKRTIDSLASAAMVNNVLKLASTDPDIAASQNDFDQTPNLLGTPGGTIDLATRNVRLPQQSDMISKQTLAGPGGPCPRWLALLDLAFDGDQDTIGAIQRFAGAALEGASTLQKFLVFYGAGGNFKGTITETLMAVFGDYGAAVDMAMFDEQGNAHGEDVLFLHGRRLVSIQESRDGQVWASHTLKKLTGGDRLTGRPNYGSPVQFEPTHNLILAVNELPTFRKIDPAIRRRILTVPCNRHLPESQQDPKFRKNILQEAGGILQWVLDGWADYQKIGLSPSQLMLDETSEYLYEQDYVERWLKANYTRTGNPTDKIKLSDMHRDWRTHAEGYGKNVSSIVPRSHELKTALVAKGLEVVTRKARIRWVLGIARKGRSTNSTRSRP